jgi:hypothetical protein
MNSLLLTIGLSIACLMATLIYHLVVRLSDSYKIKHGIEEDRSLKNTWAVKYHRIPLSKSRIIIGYGLIIITGIVFIICFATMNKYKKYGAFYDESWKYTDVAEHFHFTIDDSEELLRIYNQDPAAFNPAQYPIVMVRFGCPDCEDPEMLNFIQQIDTQNNFYLVFSRSEIGKYLVERYNIASVPCVIVAGNVFYLTTDALSPEERQDILNMRDQLIQQQQQNATESTTETTTTTE